MKGMDETTLKRLLRIYYFFLFTGVLAGVLFYFLGHPHFIFLWDRMPAFHSLFGFIGCVLIIVVSKALGHYWLMKEEDYYEKRR
ncbi:hypothetical protein DRN97_02615 [Methanosarcinales archaeon]|nr:MAG: hypothetical protein DRN97_02615 [Methanosarcinales archaeon]